MWKIVLMIGNQHITHNLSANEKVILIWGVIRKYVNCRLSTKILAFTLNGLQGSVRAKLFMCNENNIL